MRFLTLFSMAAVIAVVPALASDKKPVDPNKKICRRLEVTGSLIGGKAICHTKAEWQEIDDANANNADREMNRSREQQNLGTARTS